MKSKAALRYLLFACLLLLIAFGLRISSFADLGTQADEGVYVTVGSRLLAGDLLYRDLYWNHTPGIALLEAASLKIAGPELLLGRLLSVGAATLTVGFLILASWQISRSGNVPYRGQATPLWIDLVAGCLFACAPLAIFWSRFGMTESFETFFVVASMSFILIGLRKGAAKSWLVAGFLAGIALMFKISALVFIAAVGLFTVLWWLRERTSKPLRGAVVFVCGLGIATLPLLFGLLAQGTFADFARYLSGADRLAPFFNWQYKLTALLKWGTRSPILPLALLGTLLVMLERQSSLLLPVFWAGAEAVALLLPPRAEFGWGGFSHYALPLIAAASLVAGIGLGWAWRSTAAKLRQRVGLAILVTALILATGPSWAKDLQYVMRDTTYPMPGFTAEQEIGRALALVTPERQPVLVLGNSIFYYWADRPPATRFFQYPEFLQTSPLGADASFELRSALDNSSLGAVLLSNSYKQRLPLRVLDGLSEEWVPAATFSYPYQWDTVLYLPRHAEIIDGREPVVFEDGIMLLGLEARLLSSDTILLRLEWSTGSPLSENYSVFTHLIRPDGGLAAQHDSWPAVGSRPTSSWQTGERIVDYHWLDLPPGSPSGTYEVRVGLYQTETLQRLQLLEPMQAEGDSVTLHLSLRPQLGSE